MVERIVLAVDGWDQAGGAAMAILHAARDFGADTIVVGSRGPGGFAGCRQVGAEGTLSEISDEQLVDYLLGLGRDDGLKDAVHAEPELRRRCRVLKTELCRLDEEFAELLDTESPDILARTSWRILLAVDGSGGSRGATRAAVALASRGECVIEVLHVCECGRPVGRSGCLPGETRSEATALIDPILGELRSRGVMARGQLRSSAAGLVARNILWEAEEIGADLIVIGASPSWLSALWAPRVACAVVRKARCPVLVVR